MKLVKAIAVVACCLTSTAGFGQSTPGKPIELVVPYAAGGNVDITARIISEPLQKLLNERVLVVNKGGAGGMIAGDYVAKSAPDGHTLFVASTAPVLVSPMTFSNPLYKWDKVFSPVGLVTVFPTVLLVKKDLAAKDFKEFIALAKKNPGQLTLSTGGAASVNHLGSELLQKLTGTTWKQIHYKGNAPGLVDLAGGRLDSVLTQPSDAMPHVQQGNARPLVILGAERLAEFPGVPTVVEEGYPDAVSMGFVGVLAPINTPKDVTEKLSAALTKVVAQPDVMKKIKGIGVQAKNLPAQQFKEYLTKEEARWKPIVEAGNIKSN